MSRVCDTCYTTIREGEYEPVTYNVGICDYCGDEAFVHRISRDELEKYMKVTDELEEYVRGKVESASKSG